MRVATRVNASSISVAVVMLSYSPPVLPARFSAYRATAVASATSPTVDRSTA